MRALPIIPRPRGVLADVVRVDCALFTRVARARTPWLERGLPLLSRSANHSVLWMGVGAALAAGGGRRGKRAAVRGVGSIAVTSFVVNQTIKRAVRRPRPELRSVPVARRVKVAPLTTSFPSGHAASAAAFATGVTLELPHAAAALGPLAAAVALSRVYVGVHYPLDVLVGAGIGAGIAGLSSRFWPVLPAYVDELSPSADRRRVGADAHGDGLVVVVNPSAGARLSDDFTAQLRARLSRARVIEAGDGAELAQLLRDAAGGSAVLGIAGGDGSVALAAQAALDAGRPLLMLPSGTLNHLARDLRIARAEDALDALAAGEAVGIDAAAIDGRLFLNSAGFGAYPEMLATSDRLQPWLGRWAGHVVAFVHTLLRAEPLELEIDGRRRAVWMGFVGNCRHEPAGLGPSWRPRLDDERLDVRIVRADLRASRLRAVAAALTGRLPSSKVYSRSLVPELRLGAARSQLALAHDGEHFVGGGSILIEKLPERLVVYARHRPGQG